MFRLNKLRPFKKKPFKKVAGKVVEEDEVEEAVEAVVVMSLRDLR
jgi:hypothetical protein